MLSGSASAALSHVYARAEATFDDAAKHAKAFSTGRRNYVRQFNELYYARLNELKPHVLEHAEKRWAAQNIKLTHKVLNVEPGERTYIVGTVFIDSAAKPSTLTQVESEHWISDPRVPGGYRGDGEAVHLEDESGRIRLVGGLVDRSVLVSGLVAAMAGMETPSGCFEVVDVCYAGMPPLPPQPAPPPDACVAFVSGLRASPASPVTLEMQLLAEFLTGAVAPPLAAQIVQVVVAGDIMCLPPPPLGHSEDARANDRSAAAPLVAAVDAYLADIAAAVPLALMPGALDPTDSSLPQQPINPGLFAQCRQYSGFRSLSNPALLEVAGCLLLGSAGQNVDDIARY
ncbi:DNA polymerase delta small subunit Cdc1, partial [Coemansia sp. RSA 2322]